MRDIVHNLGLVVALPAATYAADNTPIVIDRLGFETLMLAIEVGVGGITFTGTNKVEFVLSHGDDGTTFVPVTDGDLQGVSGTTGGIVKSLKTAHAAADVTKIGYVGGKRYLQLLADFSGTHGTGTPLSALAILGGASQRPVA